MFLAFVYLRMTSEEDKFHLATRAANYLMM